MGRFPSILMLLIISVLLSLMILETLSGCGERTYFQNHTWVTGECLFIPFSPTTGRW